MVARITRIKNIILCFNSKSSTPLIIPFFISKVINQPLNSYFYFILKMRVALYNQMFGLNGKSFFSNLIGHWAVHYQENPEKVWKRASIPNTVSTLLNTEADVLGIIEVLEGQEEEIKEQLRDKGYNYFYLGLGHKTKYGGLCVQELVASKIKGEQQETGNWPVENCLGGGGGFVHVYYPKQKFHLVLAHFGLPSKKYYWGQMNFLSDYLKNMEGRTIILGDFNLEYEKIKEYLWDYRLVSRGIKTCSNTPIMKWFYNKGVDHVFVKGFKAKNFGSLMGYSDHLLLWADLI
jgi:endonuclease/exonuclease/phosphatase family metal-dependent hydrolase